MEKNTVELYALFYMARQRSSQRILASALQAQAGLQNEEQLQKLWKQFVAEMMPFQKVMQKEKDAKVLEQIAELSKTAFQVQPLPLRGVNVPLSMPQTTRRSRAQGRTPGAKGGLA